MKAKYWMRILTLTSPLLLLNSVQAESAERWEYNLGAAANTSSKYIGSDDAEYFLFPVFEAAYHIDKSSKYYAGTIRGFGVETKVEEVSLGIGLSYRYGLYGAAKDIGLSDEDPEELQGMIDPGGTVTLKPYISVNVEEWDLALEFDKGLEKDNEGWTAKLSLSYEHFFSQNMIGTIGFHVSWADEKFIDDYFGVSELEVTPTRTAYTGEAGLYSYGVMAEAVYMLSEQSVIFSMIGLNLLSDDVQNSSLVKNDLQPEITVGYTYFF
ncbi:MAG: MipA/OmpV family protein [Kangiellaceae bacterium]|nr:MipA/OmpV family protein [Kangiellaceae bacterium]